jgi:hypothetical protein
MAPPAKVTKAAVTVQVNGFLTDISRAKDLYQKIVMHGYTGTAAAHVTRMLSPDRRDAAQFIFFEVAAKFEEHAKSMFQIEVRSRLKVTTARSEYVMGDLDNGLNNKLGWGSPPRLKERGYNLFGVNSFFGDLVDNLGPNTYNTLIAAHTVRNRIAHSGGAALTKFVKLLEDNAIPANQRQGMSVGRFIRDYPVASPPTDKHFYRYLAAYSDFSTKAGAALP